MAVRSFHRDLFEQNLGFLHTTWGSPISGERLGELRALARPYPRLLDADANVDASNLDITNVSGNIITKFYMKLLGTNVGLEVSFVQTDGETVTFKLSTAAASLFSELTLENVELIVSAITLDNASGSPGAVYYVLGYTPVATPP